MAELVSHCPERYEYIDDYIIRWILRELVKVSDRERRARWLNELFDAWGDTTDYQSPDSLWMNLMVLAIERGDVSRAAVVAARLQEPHSLVGVRADKRFDALVQANPQLFDVERAANAAVDRWRVHVAEQPSSVPRRIRLVAALGVAGRYSEMLAESNEALRVTAASPSGKSAADDFDRLSWLVHWRADALRALGRRSEALRELSVIGRQLRYFRSSVSHVINLAGSLCDYGDTQTAWKVIKHIDDDDVSPYGMMRVRRVRQCISLQEGNAWVADWNLDYMRRHSGDLIDAFQAALVAAKYYDEAAASLRAQLADPDRRTTVLTQVQIYKPRPEGLFAQQVNEQWDVLLARPDVRAAITEVGRRETFAIEAADR